MPPRRRFLATTAALFLALPGALPALAAAQEHPIRVEDAQVLAILPTAPAAAAFMTIVNTGATDDRLIDVRSDAAGRVELHTHVQTADGVIRMRPVEGGIGVPAGASHVLERGGDHVMLMGLTAPLLDGGTVMVTLDFEVAGPVEVEIPVRVGR